MYERDEVQRYLAERVARPSSAGVVIENTEGEALVLKANYKSYWSLPGGWAEDTQTPLQAAVRELVEETGVVRTSDQLEFVRVITRGSSIMQTYQFIFRSTVSYTQDEVIALQQDEIDEYRFVSKDEVLSSVQSYGLAVVLWAQNDTSGYVEQRLEL